MSFLELHPDLKDTNKQLKRIADCLVEILRNAYGIHMEPMKADTSGDEPTVGYADDATTLRSELVDVKNGLNPERAIETDEPEPFRLANVFRQSR